MNATYQVNEVFYSIQGEGMKQGTPMLFLRFSGCNLTCAKDGEAGFDCDTEFVSGRKMDLRDINGALAEAVRDSGTPEWVLLTGGEPGLQVDAPLIEMLRGVGFKVAIETNGTIALPDGIEWVCVSPKSAEHTIRQRRASEVKYVRNVGQGIPRPACTADHKLISPAFRTLTRWVSAPSDDPAHALEVHHHEPEPGALEWCIRLVKENPSWRLSVQQHKLWGVR